MAKDQLQFGRLALVLVGSTAIAVWCHFAFGSTWLEVAGFVTGVVGVYLASIEHVWNWPVGIVNVAIYAVFFYQSRLFADASLQVMYFALLCHGWWSWAYRPSGATELSVQALAWKKRAFVLLAIVVGTALYYPIISSLKGQQPFLDTSLTVTSIAAQILLNRKYIENWVLWIAADIVYIPLFLSQKYYPTAILYGIFLVLAIYGLLQWRKSLSPQLYGESKSAESN